MFAISKDDPVAAGGFRSPAESSYPELRADAEPLAAPASPRSSGSAGSGRRTGASGFEGLAQDREQSEFQQLLAYALKALARREHSAVELRRKLGAKSGAEATAKTDEHIGQVIDALLLDGSLSDESFAAEFVRSRIGKGYGPIRIRMDLLERGVPDRLAEEELTRPSEFWQQQAAEVCMRKFGADTGSQSGSVDAGPDLEQASPAEVREAIREQKEASQRRWNRCARFLSQRGFPADLIYRTLDGRLLED